MSTAFPMRVLVSGMLGMALGNALVEVPVVGGVKVPVMDVVDMVSVRDSCMSAAVTMNMIVTGVFDVRIGHGCPSWECLIASLTM